MELKVSSNTLVINGNIKSISDFQNIKRSIDNIIIAHKHININIEDSLSITSSVIGYLNKLVLKDSIDLHMSIGNEQLLRLLDDLNLASTFKAKRN
ncbi:hypothetical protein [Sulfurimonas sp.]|jgi:hypothetical protein|uniref:hypothetical protein n=1 Tax=Sulfurimonas sp. TaxID=2022749 RepID=UPI0025ECA196|nr:hypothetical protein [Sulfurimonas sp.]MCK9472723.1 hypothetical protein [Sulfurimonas sp.]MDD3505239.1 hypothetical protein [Sulfurimonas sp.]